MRIVVVAALSLFALMAALPATAQNTDIEALSGLQFNFGNPGARALGMGGAFIGLADDASAAEANPAGLTILRKSEVSLEARQTITSQTFVTGGTYPFETSTDFPARQKALSFASVVMPAGGSVVALYYHRPLSIRNKVDPTGRYGTPTYYLGPNGPVSKEQCPSVAGCVERLIYPFSSSVDVQIETYGIAMARQWKTFSFGAAVRYHRFEENADAFRRDLDLVGQPVFVVAQVNGGRLVGNESDKDVSFVAGAKWAPTQNLSFGAVYKEGPSFAAAVQAGAEGQVPSTIGITRFHVPSTGGVGVAWRASGATTLTADAIRVTYSHLSDRFLSVIEYGAATSSPEQVSGYTTRDGTELHAGVEYFVLGTAVPVALRGGWWRDPAHAIAYHGPVTTADEVAAKVLFPDGQSEHHYSVGIGLTWPRFQVDAAYDTSRSLKRASLSMIARF